MQNRTIATLVAALALAACGQVTEQDELMNVAAIRNLTEARESAYNARDAAAIGRLYAQDAVLQPPGAPVAAGPASIQQYLAGELEKAELSGLTLEIHDVSTTEVHGDFAYDAGTFSIADGSGATVDNGKYLAVFRKHGDTWKFLRDTWNSDGPPVATDLAPAG